ncbi:hypothetical protein ACLIBH_07950 [Virgibacillus sp. W0430]
MEEYRTVRRMPPDRYRPIVIFTCKSFEQSGGQKSKKAMILLPGYMRS